MKKLEPGRGTALSVLPPARDYEVGYGKPPEGSRFSPGKSGNPRGRPKGAKNRNRLPALNEERLKTIILEEAYRHISVNDAKGPVTIPMVQAVIRSVAVNAAKGNQRAQRLFAELVASVETANKRLHDEWLETAITYKVEWERELEKRSVRGIDAPAPLPHPDDIVIDMKTGLVRVTGPMTKEEKVVWDRVRDRKTECDQTIAELNELLGGETDQATRKLILDDIERERQLRTMISRVIPD